MVRIGRIVVALGLAALVVAIVASGLADRLSLAGLKQRQGELVAAYGTAPLAFVAGFVATQAVALTLLIPGSVALFALAAGAVLGPVVGTLVVLAAVTLGDSLSFLIARYLVRDWAARRFADSHARFERGMARGGAWYLLALRLAGFVPFFVTNIAMALTRIRLRVFAPVSFVGLIPTVVLHVNAGVQLGRVERVGDVLSPPVIAAFAALGAFPLAMRWLLTRVPSPRSA